jgi:hypothetical protein
MGRITKGAALGILARVFLYQGKWQECYDAAQLVKQSNEYSLIPQYFDNFILTGENGKESIFELGHFDSPSLNTWSSPFFSILGGYTNVFQSARDDGFPAGALNKAGFAGYKGYGVNIPTNDLVNEFEPGDPRLHHAILFEGDTVQGLKMAYNNNPEKKSAKKYFIFKEVIPKNGTPNISGRSNLRILRYSDLLLMLAESAYHLSKESESLGFLEEVRARAREGNDILPKVAASGADLLSAIKHERRVELALEGQRFFDLVRWGDAYDKLKDTGYGFKTEKNELFPIPQTEIDITGGSLIQNPNY